MKKLLILLLFTTYFTSFAQKARVKGLVLDSLSQMPISYANISILDQNKKLVSGVITDEKGKFNITNIPFGNYIIHIDFMGFASKTFNNYRIQKANINLGKIYLSEAKNQLNTVIINHRKSAIVYKVDKQILNASAFQDAQVAFDMLENVPSMQLSADGKLTYRDDAIFIVMINGKTVANGVERLKQIPTNQIDKIEIITSPSAKHDAEGTAGIINVILKKNRLKGFDISSKIQTSTKKDYQWSFSVSKNTDTWGWYVNGNLSKYVSWSGQTEQQMTIYQDNNTQNTKVFSKSVKEANRSQLNIGFNYDLTSKDEIDVSFFINPLLNTEDRLKNSAVQTSIDDSNNPINDNYNLKNKYDVKYRYFGPDISFTHKFDKEGNKKIAFSASYAAYLNNYEEITKDYKTQSNNDDITGSKYVEEDEQTLDLKLDLTYPINDKYSFESGIKISTDYIPKTYVQDGYFDQDKIIPFENNFAYQEIVFKRNIYATYASFIGKIRKFEYKIGLRVEQTDRKADYYYRNTNASMLQSKPSNTNFIDFFPSFHGLYNLKDDNQISVSYSRRIGRANYFSLMPIRQYTDVFSYSVGNADLQPNYADYIEVNYLKTWKNNYISVQLFGNHAYNNIYNIKRIDAQNLIYYRTENAGSSIKLGSEFRANYKINKWWTTNLAFSVYYYNLKTNIDSHINEVNRINSNIRFNNNFQLPKNYKIALKFRCFSPGVSAQTKWEASYLANFSVSKNLGKHWKINVFVNNIFGDYTTQSILKTAQLQIYNRRTEYFYTGFSIKYHFNNRR